ncbi:MAG: hypothetical protein HZA66_04190 [Rhodopseudomonas palustris]|uniref:Uncharacterized protein n=1 Tax=Rhodopseudomonas palustris TaxID=1076 RepID=A0A933W076_RHOPL|nr:hypothetical protein [Rhodopseudomonas palustris]
MSHATASGVGLMAFWADIDPDYVLRYQQWHNCEHIPERVSIPGFREGRRYRTISDAPHFLMFYETDATSVLASAAYMAALNTPTDWTREALTHFRNPVRSIYTRLAAAGQAGPFTSPYVVSLRFDLPEGGEDDYAGAWIAAVGQSHGVSRARLWRADAAVSNIATSERKIYGGGPGKQAYLALIELELPPDQLPDPVAAGDAACAVRRADEERGSYWLEIAHRSPTAHNDGN